MSIASQLPMSIGRFESLRSCFKHRGFDFFLGLQQITDHKPHHAPAITIEVEAERSIVATRPLVGTSREINKFAIAGRRIRVLTSRISDGQNKRHGPKTVPS